MDTIKTRVLIISDTHGARLSQQEGKGKPLYPPFKAPLPSADLLIHCGDLTYVGRMEEYEAALDLLKEIDAPVKLVIAGNHDLSLDKEFVFSHISKQKSGFKWVQSQEEASSRVKEARDFWLSPSGRARLEGVTFLEEGLHQIQLQNGARINVYASPYTPEFHDFGFAYRRNEDRFNPADASFTDATNIAKSPVPSFATSDPVDFMIVHGPPYGRLDETARGEHAGCPHLLKAVARSRPRVCCFGHIHEAWGAERVRWMKIDEQRDKHPTSTKIWKQDGWRQTLDSSANGIERVAVDLDSAKTQHSAYLDLSASSGNGLKRGEETMLVNASIMDLRYNPVNAPWLLDIDLPMGR